jgi:hypothetical protein
VEILAGLISKRRSFSLAGKNVEETLLIARSLEDASTKVRALASVVKYMTDEKRLKLKSKLPVANVGAKEIQP